MWWRLLHLPTAHTFASCAFLKIEALQHLKVSDGGTSWSHQRGARLQAEFWPPVFAVLHNFPPRPRDKSVFFPWQPGG